MVKRNLVALIISLLFTAQAVAAPDNSMSIVPTAESGQTITASDENSRNNEISTKYNAHGHSDTNDLSTNTLTIGDGAVGSKTYAVDTDQANDPGLRYNTTSDFWTLSQDGSTYLAAAHAETTAGLTSGAMLFASGGTVSGAIADAGVASDGQFLIGRSGGTPILGSITGSNGITITNGSGTIDVSSPAFATPALTLGTANSAGAASTVIRSDATVAAFDATAPTTITHGAAASAGSAAVAARRDHTHGAPGSPAWEFVESLSTASGTSVTSGTLPTDSDLFMVVFENVGGTATEPLTFSIIDNVLRIEVATLGADADNQIAEFGDAGSTNGVNGVLYVPRLATNGKIICPASISYETSAGGQGVTLRCEDTGASTLTTLTFGTSTGFTSGKIHIYKSIPS